MLNAERSEASSVKLASSSVDHIARKASPVSQEMLRFAQHKLRCLPDAIVTKAYAPILIIGAAGGLIAAVAGVRWSI